MSTPTTHQYETIYILRGGVSESDFNTIGEKIDSVIKKFKGSVSQKDDWGVSELAYPINKERNGRFIVMNYQGDSGVVEEIERHFRISNDVIRYLTVMVDKDYDYAKVKRQMHAAAEELQRNREAREKKRG